MTNQPGRPTSWRNLIRTGCAYSLRLIEDGAPYDREVFGAGTAAHAWLDTYARGGDTAAAVMKLCTEGRAGAGHVPKPGDVPEPPISLHAATTGSDMARAFMDRDPWEWHDADPRGLPVGCRSEVPVAMNAAFELVDWDAPDVAHRTVLDLLFIREDETDEGEPLIVVHVFDYKTSWRAAEDLDVMANIQRRYQVLAAMALHPDADGVVAGIAAVRTGAIHELAPIWREDSADMLTAWRDEIAALESVRHAAEPSPGAGCALCPVAAACDAAETVSDSEASRYVYAKGVVAALESKMRRASKVKPVSVPGGGWIGYTDSQTRKPRHDVTERLMKAWRPDGWGEMADTVSALLMALPPGVTSLGKAIKWIHPGRGPIVKAARQGLEDELIRVEPSRTFGVHVGGAE